MLPDVPVDVPVSVVLTGGAGAVAGVASLATKKGHRLVGLEAAVRDLDDMAGNVRRITAAVDAARADGDLADTGCTSSCRRPTRPPTGWQPRTRSPRPSTT